MTATTKVATAKTTAVVAATRIPTAEAATVMASTAKATMMAGIVMVAAVHPAALVMGSMVSSVLMRFRRIIYLGKIAPITQATLETTATTATGC